MKSRLSIRLLEATHRAPETERPHCAVSDRGTGGAQSAHGRSGRHWPCRGGGTPPAEDRAQRTHGGLGSERAAHADNAAEPRRPRGVPVHRRGRGGRRLRWNDDEMVWVRARREMGADEREADGCDVPR